MVVFQYHGCVYYRTIKEILPGQELLVWYDTRYSQFMGVPVALSDSGTRGKSFLSCVSTILLMDNSDSPFKPSCEAFEPDRNGERRFSWELNSSCRLSSFVIKA